MKRSRFWAVALFCYGVLMIWLMFFRLRSGIWEDSSDYWEHITTQYNLVPFRMILGYVRELAQHLREEGLTWNYRIWAVSRNLFGNIGMLVPLGFLLPVNFPGLRKLWKTLLAVAGIIVFLELAQLLTLAGHCDIDDLILNLLGGAMGYGLYAITLRRSEKV